MIPSSGRSSACALGSGWAHVETFDGERFRWAAGEAELFVALLRRQEYRIDLSIEAGPSASDRPLPLAVVDVDSGDVLANLRLDSRRRQVFALPVGPPRVYRLRLHVPPGRVASDGRMLNFRLFDVDVKAIPNDILPPAAGYVIGPGWGLLETYQDEYFRWVDNDAIVEMRSEALRPLVLELEAGPGVGFGATLVVINDTTGETIGTSPLLGRGPVTIAGPAVAAPATLRLHVEGGGRTTAGDPRVLNFRVLEYPSAPE